ncbi:ANTAR domain-containing response regulator [Roseovarius atlanticus]|uniref:ANTAR domain-containing response regulator n=1 Tax=Roseovarius atlanticus TaxID=1641875 RepID=UPI001C944B00|nr:ANTAR domain-containing protein [Roseovarius atlanticus]MBY5988320.1 ANTAR domain-containing protein [Roseovarius atlanticus]MBY6123711.1 ANTAR domain-containing protein [Roseovarius atlanticus]MBY6148206.1 ANTAR domain-containing protein [Roseovarius atlanticus]
MSISGTNDQNLLRRLRRKRVLVIHPDDEDRRTLLAQLRRIGCQTEKLATSPDVLPSEIDVVLFLLLRNQADNSVQWMAEGSGITRIAIISYETPEILTALERLHVHAVVSKPIRIFGVLAALTTAISLSQHEARLQQRVRSLDDTLKARRRIEKAVAILSKRHDITEEISYKRLREKSMRDNVTISDIADAVIASDDV